eukprot:11404147-Ditylum_brightwellii.AAC.1
MVFIKMDTLDLFAIGMPAVSSMTAVFSADTCTVISSRDKLEGIRLRILTSLLRKALSSDKGIFLRHISSMRLQKRADVGGKVSSNKKSVVLPGTSFRKLARLLAYFCALSLCKPVVCRMCLESCKNATNAYAQLPPPTDPTCMRIDNQYAEQYYNKYGVHLDCNKVLPVVHALQGHLESGALWE